MNNTIDEIDLCQRCGRFWRKCVCERNLRPERDIEPRGKYELDEDVAAEFERNHDDRWSPCYSHGFNVARKYPGLRNVKCPYRDPGERREFYRGVSDARWARE